MGRSRHGVSQLILVLLGLALGGCGDETKGLTWTIGFASDSLRTRVHAVEAFIVEGGCASIDPDAAIWSQTIRPGDTEGPSPPALSPGTYGFAARARDVSCRWYAEGCTEVELGAEDSPTMVRTVLGGSMVEAICPGECMAGECPMPDAGPPDAGDLDAGGMDASEPDAGREDAGPRDTGPRDTGPRDTGPRDTGPRDTGPPDTGPPDTGPPDAGRRSCDEIYGAAAGYLLCIETSTSCEFYTLLSGASCDDVCSALGGSCIETYGDTDNTCLRGSGPSPCSGTYTDTLCVCTRT